MLLLAVAASSGVGCTPTSEPQPSDPGEITVAVLPFEVSGQREGADYVGLAVARSLAADLEPAEGIRILEVQPDAAGATPSGASRILSGTLVRDGGTVRAEVRLDGGQDDSVWTGEAAAEGGDLSAIAVELSRQIAAELDVTLPRLYDYIAYVEGAPAMASSPLRARLLAAWARGDMEDFLAAAEALVERYADDPAAHALHAWSLMVAWDRAPSRDPLVRLRERLAELDRIDPASPYDDLIRSYVYRTSGQPEPALRLYSQVVGRRDLSSSARAWALRQRSYAYLQVGNTEAARADAEQAVALDPANAAGLVALSKALDSVGLLDEAAIRARQALALEPRQWRHEQRLGVIYTRAGRFDDAVQSLERACELGRNQEACANLAVALQRGSRPREARAAATRAEALAGTSWGLYNLGCFWALRGDNGRAIDALRRAAGLGFADVLINTDADLDALRDDPAFADVLAEIGERISLRRELSQSVFPWQ